MTIDEAIKILIEDRKERLICSITELRVAQQLGIEALKRVKKERETIGKWHSRILPEETEG